MKNGIVGFLLFLISFNPSNAQNTRMLGKWHGKLETGSFNLDLYFTIKSMKIDETETIFQTRVDVPIQNLKNHPFDETTIKKNKITLTDGKLNVVFEGELKDTNRISGIFKQRGRSIPLILTKFYGTINQTKPQTPQPPFNYNNTTVSFSNKDGKIKFAGTITYPQSADSNQKFPTIILFTGSGAQDRDESIGYHKPFAVIADFLTKAGFAVLRVDDRGAGFTRTSPEKMQYTTKDLIEDGDDYYHFAIQQKMVNPEKIYLIGHSEGGSIATGVAQKNPKIKGIIGIAPMLATWAETNAYQNYWGLKNGGVDSVIISNFMPLHKLILAKLCMKQEIPNDSTSHDIIESSLKEWMADPTFGIEKNKKKVKKFYEKTYQGKMNLVLFEQYKPLFTNPWMFNFFKVTPAAEMVHLKMPILVLQGKKDQQISFEQSEEVVKMLQTVGRNIQIELFENHNHLLQHCKTGNINEYLDNQESFSPEVLMAMVNWLRNN